MDQLWERLPQLIDGTKLTILFTIIGIIFGIILGLLLALGRISKIFIIDKFCWFYVWLLRGTPLMMQLFFIYYTFPLFFNPPIAIPAIYAAIIAFSLNSGAYLAEIFRAAILSIDKGQFEASKALGFTYPMTMRRIIIPQSIRRLIPPVGNEVIMLLKDTSLVAFIGLQDLLRIAKGIQSDTASPLIFIPTAIIYLLLTTLLTLLFDHLEKRFSVYE